MYKGMKNVQTIAVMVMVMLLFAGEATASFQTCFPPCAMNCLSSGNTVVCAVKCLVKCLVGGGSSTQNYCKIGCAMEKCALFTFADFHVLSVQKVNNCVNLCENEECGVDPPQLSPTGAPLL